MAHDLGLAGLLYLGLSALLGARRSDNSGCMALLLHAIGWVALACFLRGLGV